MPAYSAGLTLNFKITVTNAASRLGTLIGGTGIPTFDDARYTRSTGPIPQRAPYHVLFQVPSAAANPVYVTWDNNTAPVVGGPGLELEQGIIYKFENAGPALLFNPTPSTALAFYPFNAQSAFQLIATANTSLLVTFSD
jgi:hypothetical protein